MTYLSLALSTFALQAVAQEGLKAVLVGRPQPIATLVSQPSAVPFDRHNALNVSDHLDGYIRKAEKEQVIPLHEGEDDGDDIPALLGSDPDEVYDEFSAYVPYGEANGQTLVRRSITKRAAFRGTMMMNCKKAREACQNACWYQNCVNSGSTVTYEYDSSSNNAKNRVEAGTTVTRGTPCASWPFGQRFWDMYPWTRQKPTKDSQRNLETDEWPMADFKNDPFDPNASRPQHSLRCITAEDNVRGQRQWVNFRDAAGYYNTGRKYASKRLGNTRFVTGDTFNVEFDMSEFDDNNADDVKAKADLLYYCTGNFNNCENDGRQFHMTSLEKTTGRDLDVGILNWPYDPNAQNKYRVDGESDDIKSYFVTVEVTGDDGDELKATAQTYIDGAYTDLDSKGSTKIDIGKDITLKGSLPQNLKIVRTGGSGCTTGLEFTYGTPAANTLDWFVFKSDAKGVNGRWSWIETGSSSGKYCQVSEMTDSDGDYTGTKFYCTFPGW